MPESLRQVRQRVRWGIARARSAVAEFGGDATTPPAASALGHLTIAERELTAWIDAGISDYPPLASPSIPEAPLIRAKVRADGRVALDFEGEPGGPIRYTLDDSDVDETSPLYEGTPVVIP